LRGHLASDENGIDDANVRHRRLPLSLLSVACRTVALGIPYFGPVPKTDPCAALVPKRDLAERGLALLPLRLGDHTVALLLGHPRRSIDRDLRDVLSVLVLDAAKGLGALIAAARAERRGPSSTPEADDADEGLGDDTINDAMERDTEHQRPPVDVGAGTQRGRRRRKTLSGHAGSRLIVSNTATTHRAVSLDAAPQRSKISAPVPSKNTEEEVFLLTRRKPSGEQEVGAFAEQKAERRQHLRLPLDLEVHYRREDGLFNTGFVEDISAGGLFIATGADLVVGERLNLTFALPSWRDEITVLGEVRWIRPNSTSRDQLMGVGLRFIDLPKKTREAITDLARAQTEEMPSP
ncbi:MAG: TIGR02266 family protein, partial [Deltaproteobacteria bacterium]|nr:TIGR02266 family protein [Deltaproteobacteria bacterium]